MKNTSYKYILLSSIMAISAYSHAAKTHDYVTSVKVNNIEINQAILASQIDKIYGKSIQKISKEYSECTGNTEYSTTYAGNKALKFEIFNEDNPQIKSNTYFKNKNNFKQLGTTKGVVWLNWNNTQYMSEYVRLDRVVINSLYTVKQFKKDFKVSAKNNSDVLILSKNDVKNYLKKPEDFDVNYTSHVHFEFKNGKISALNISQGIAC